MSLWRALFGGGSAAQAIGAAADALHTSDEEKNAQDLQEGQQVRAFAAPGGEGVINDLINACNRSIRPGVTIWLFGGFAGMWRLPPPDLVDPFWQQIALIVVTFWFGGRMLLKDLPGAIAAVVELRARMRGR